MGVLDGVWSNWTERDVPDLTGRVAVVTGGNGGLGLATVDALAAAGARVLVAARDQAKTADAIAGVRDRHPSASLEVVPLDLADLSSVRAAAEVIVALATSIRLSSSRASTRAVLKTLDRSPIDTFFTRSAIS